VSLPVSLEMIVVGTSTNDVAVVSASECECERACECDDCDPGVDGGRSDGSFSLGPKESQ
jgi:hypothetical protein